MSIRRTSMNKMNESVEEIRKANEAAEKKGDWKSYLKMAVGYTFVALVTIFIFKHVIMLNLIPSGSMEGTINTGNTVIATRYDADDIERYDIMVFYAPDDPDTLYIKRVIGLPGETIVVKDGSVYADGVELEDDFIKEAMNSSGDGTYEVPEGCYFMMGDNRNSSLDSRFWDNKYVSADAFVAKSKLIIPTHFEKYAEYVCAKES